MKAIALRPVQGYTVSMSMCSQTSMLTSSYGVAHGRLEISLNILHVEWLS